MPIGYKTISIKTEDAQYLENIKVHPNQPIWEVIQHWVGQHKINNLK
jgi:hypothetical protein